MFIVLAFWCIMFTKQGKLIMATIRDIAKDANVSITTVSRVLTNDQTFHISEETKAKVLDSVKKNNYKFKTKKRQLSIGVIMSLTYKYNDPYFFEILDGIQEYCSKHNAVISLIISCQQFEESKNALESKIKDLDGLIVTDIPDGGLDFLTSLNNCLVFVDHYTVGYCNVGYNIYHSNELVMQHLIDYGYRKIAYIGGPSEHVDFLMTKRMVVYREALRKAGIDYDESILYDCGWNSEICKQKVKDLLNKHPDVDAIFAGSDSLAVIVLKTLKELKINCPKDIGVIGFNDNEIASTISPALTTVKLPSRDMGRYAAKRLISQINKKQHNDLEVNLPVKLIVRQSTRKK